KGISYQTARSEQQLSPAEVGDLARPFTIHIECNQADSRVAVAPPTSNPSPPPRDQLRVFPPTRPQEPGSQSGPPRRGPQAGATVAQRVILYEEDPTDRDGHKLVGSVVWRTEKVTPGAGQSPELAIRADVDVPERKLAMTWSLR